jgi:serine protease Do
MKAIKVHWFWILFLMQNASPALSLPSSALEKELVQLVDKVKPSVVTISASFYASTKKKQQKDSVSSQSLKMMNIGSGIVLDSLHIITRTSVVEGCDHITVQFCDGRKTSAEYIGSDPVYRFAVIRTREHNLHAPQIGNSNELKVGSWITLVGNSLGVTPAVSMGVVRAVRKDGIIQLSANVAAGNVGGPIFDTKGTLVAILAAKITAIDDLSLDQPPFLEDNGALAIGADVILQRTKMIIKQTNQAVAWLGVTAKDHPEKQGWIQVMNINQKSPAAKAGLQEGDVIFQLNQDTVNNTLKLAETIWNHKPGDEIQLGIIRQDSARQVTVILDKPPQQDGQLPVPASEPAVARSVSFSAKGTYKQGVKPPSREVLLKRIDRLEREVKLLRSMLK